MRVIDFARAIKAPFEDKDWVTKTLIGFLLALSVIFLPTVYGAQLDYIRRVSKGDETLPGWDDFGNKWVEGFLVFLAGLIYFLPVLVIGVVFLAPPIIALVTGGQEDVFGSLLAGGTCLFILLAVVYSIAVSVLFSAALTHYAMRGGFGSFFDFGGILAKVRGGTGYFTAWLYTIAISIIASFITSVLSSTGVGGILAPAVTYLMAIMTGHVLGQWAALAYAPAPAVTTTYAPPPPAPPM